MNFEEGAHEVPTSSSTFNALAGTYFTNYRPAVVQRGPVPIATGPDSGTVIVVIALLSATISVFGLTDFNTFSTSPTVIWPPCFTGYSHGFLLPTLRNLTE